MQIVWSVMLFVAFAGAETAMFERAQKIVPQDANYRLLSGPEAQCPGEESVQWRQTKGGPLLQLTPSLSLYGFDKAGWVKRPQSASAPDCVFESKMEVTGEAIRYWSKESCPSKNWSRRQSRTLEKKGELGLSVTLRTAETENAVARSELVVNCELQRQR